MNLDHLFELAREDRPPALDTALADTVLARVAAQGTVDAGPLAMLAFLTGAAAALAASLALLGPPPTDPQEELFPTINTRLS